MENITVKDKPERAAILWMHEAVTYLGLDRLGLARPERAIYRLIKRGALHPKKLRDTLLLTRENWIYSSQMGIKNGEKAAPENFVLHKLCIKKNVIKSTLKTFTNKKPI